MPPPDPMVGDWLDRGMVFSIVGAYGTAKTFVLLDMALAVATGTPWLDQPIHHTGPVLYIVAEGGYTIGPRVRGWCRHHDIDDVPEQFLVYPDRVNLLNEIQRAELVEAAIELQPALVIIDTMAQSMPGGDENSSVDMSMIFEAVDRVRKETGASVGFARHTGHGVKGRGRGFSGFEDNSDVVFSVEGKVKDGPVRLESQKQKARENPMPLAVALTIDEGGDPFLRVTSAGPNVGTGDERLTKARQVLISTAKRYRGSEPLSRREWTDRAAGVAKDFRTAAFEELVTDGYFVPTEVAVAFGSGTRSTTKYEPNKEMLDGF